MLPGSPPSSTYASCSSCSWRSRSRLVASCTSHSRRVRTRFSSTRERSLRATPFALVLRDDTSAIVSVRRSTVRSARHPGLMGVVSCFISQIPSTGRRRLYGTELCDELHATIDAVAAPLTSLLRVFLVSALLGWDVLVHNFTTGRTTTNRWVRPPVVEVRTCFSVHGCSSHLGRREARQLASHRSGTGSPNSRNRTSRSRNSTRGPPILRSPYPTPSRVMSSETSFRSTAGHRRWARCAAMDAKIAQIGRWRLW